MELDGTPSGENLVWRCFHCGLVCTTELEAQDHFGLDEMELPACVQLLTETEKVIVEERRQWKQQCHTMQATIERLEDARYAEQAALGRIGPKVRSANDAYNAFETEQGMRLSAEEKVRFLVRRLDRYGVPWQPLPHDERTLEQILAEGDASAD